MMHAELYEQLITVLIDTWWNVNEWLVSYNEHSASFNRYMVECEL